jgi:hypothetical protein
VKSQYFLSVFCWNEFPMMWQGFRLYLFTL